MQRQELLQQLGLTPAASSTDIRDAISAKREQLQSKAASAPTDALKTKYQTMLDQLTQAEKALAEPAAKPRFSQTQLDDMPQSATQFEETATAQLKLQAGMTLAGRYEIKEQIGAGGMGAVYRAHDKNTNKAIALKVLLPALLASDRAKSRFIDEARISQQLSHPNIVNVYDVQNDGDYYFLTMELLEGQDLRQVMNNRKLARQHFPLTETAEIISAIANGLAYAHRYTVHRDIKPENIWVTEEGDYKVMDFGIAQVQSTSQRTKTGAAMGTAYYMAPEQLRGAKDIDGRADQYALAVMAYELLSGEVPAGRIEPLYKLCKGLPRKISDAIDKGLSSKPDERYPTVLAFSEALNAKGASLPAIPWPKLGLAAGILAAVIGVGALASNGAFNLAAIKSILPQSQEDISQQKAELAKLLGQINVTKKRLEEARRKLENEVRDAERDKGNTARVAELTHWQTITESALFNGTQITELEGELAMAEAFNRDGSLTQAKTSYEKVLTGYTGLLDEFNSAEHLQSAAEASAKAKQDWLAIKAEFKLEDPQAVADATTQEQTAKSEEQQSHFKAALVKWREAKSQWEQSPQDMASAIAAVKQKRLDDKAFAEAEAKRQAEEARQAAEAKHKKIIQDTLVMVTIPAGSYQMGDSTGYGSSDEKPVHTVNIRSFKMSRHEVTFSQWDACVEAGGCSHKPSDLGWGRGSRPVIDVSYNDITQQYIPWLNQLTGKRFRLPTEAEWEYAARAGTTTHYPWGNRLDCSKARYDGGEGSNCYFEKSDGSYRGTASVGSYSPNSFGLYDMHGNVWEWVQDCDHDSYSGAPTDGSAWTSGDCGRRVLRGGSWLNTPDNLRSATRLRSSASARDGTRGFRLVQD